MKILFITPYSSEGASNRYRVEQYLPYLKDNGFEYSVRPFVSSEFYRIIYKKGHMLKKIYYFYKGLIKRMADVFDAAQYDIIFIHREACPLGPPFFEWAMHRLNKPIIFDFDDAIFLRNFNPANSIYRYLKFPSKTNAIIRMSSAVIAANTFLKEYAQKFNSNVYIIPTSIDTKKFCVSRKNSDELVIGWVGSPTAAPYLKIIFGAMQKLSSSYNFILRIVGAEKEISIPGVKIENIEWQLNREIQDFQNIDIGIYPLHDIMWTKGKAAFKAIQYMSVGIPVVASPVGMTKELIKEGENGFLAGSEAEWVDKIARLIESPDLRRQIGLAGKRTVEEKYSVGVNASKFIEIINKVAR